METLPSTSYKLVSADSLEGNISLVESALSLEDAKSSIHRWVGGQGRHWPEELSGEVLTENIQHLYIAHWLLDAKASGKWSSVIGIEHKRIALCSDCNGKGRRSDSECWKCSGSGRVQEYDVVWNPASGEVRSTIRDVVQNIEESIPIRCGKMDFQAKKVNVSHSHRYGILLLSPKEKINAFNLSLRERALKESVQKQLWHDAVDSARRLTNTGRSRDTGVYDSHVSRVYVETGLYPIYMGPFLFEEEVLLVQVDGVTGKIHVDIPRSVRNKRVKDWLIAIFLIALVGAIFYLIASYVGWL